MLHADRTSCNRRLVTAAFAGSGVNQSLFLTSSRASGGFHNFSAQATVLRRMATERLFTPHWGNCERNVTAGAPEAYLNSAERPARAKGGGGGGGARRTRRGRGGSGGGKRGGGKRGGGGRGGQQQKQRLIG